MFLTKFLYDLTGHLEPTNEELDDEIDRLLLKKSAEVPSYLVPQDQIDPVSAIDSEAISFWIKRRFEPILILLLTSEDNYQQARRELCKMDKYKDYVERFLRCYFVEKQALQRVRELCFDDVDELDLKRLVEELRRTLTFLSNHLELEDKNPPTLLGTDMYTASDVTLYNYLKRIVVGKYKDLGLKSHIRLCNPLIKFMHQFASKNIHVIDVANEDPIANPEEETSILADITKPAIIVVGFIVFFLWRRG